MGGPVPRERLVPISGHVVGWRLTVPWHYLGPRGCGGYQVNRQTLGVRNKVIQSGPWGGQGSQEWSRSPPKVFLQKVSIGETWAWGRPEHAGEQRGVQALLGEGHAEAAAADGLRGGEFQLFWFPVTPVSYKKTELSVGVG